MTSQKLEAQANEDEAYELYIGEDPAESSSKGVRLETTKQNNLKINSRYRGVGNIRTLRDLKVVRIFPTLSEYFQPPCRSVNFTIEFLTTFSKQLECLIKQYQFITVLTPKNTTKNWHIGSYKAVFLNEFCPF